MRLKGDDFSLYAPVWHGTLNEDPKGSDEIVAYVSSSTGGSTDTPKHQWVLPIR